MDDPRMRRCLEDGVSVLVGSVDSQGNPMCCRAIALTSHDDLATATVYLPMATSHETVANLAATGRVAVVATQPGDHCSTQLKGMALTTRAAREDEEPLVRKHLGNFAGVLGILGVPPRVTKGMAHWPAVAVEMRVDEIYDQSPGPRAGVRLR